MMQWPTALPRWLSASLFAGALGAAFWRAPTPAPTTFLPPPTITAATLAASFTTEMLPKMADWAQAASLASLPDGRMAVAWLAASAAEAEDATIWYSTQDKDGWQPPQPIANRASTAGGTFAHIRTIGRPVLYAEGSWLHLWYASQGFAGERSNTLNHSFSTDAGKSWMKPVRLQTTPFANISSVAKAPPLALADGGLGMPVSQTFLANSGEWLRLAPTGEILDKIRLPHQAGSRQLAVLALDGQHALAMLGDDSSGTAQIQVTVSRNGGKDWAAGEALTLANAKAPFALLRLKSGRLLLAGNPPTGRQALLLWVSSDLGQTWQPGPSVEAATDGGADFANPALLLSSDGRVHLAYTWRQQRIKYATFSEAWLDGVKP